MLLDICLAHLQIKIIDCDSNTVASKEAKKAIRLMLWSLLEVEGGVICKSNRMKANELKEDMYDL